MNVLRLHPADLEPGDYALDTFGEMHLVSSVDVDGGWVVIHDVGHELALIAARESEITAIRGASDMAGSSR